MFYPITNTRRWIFAFDRWLCSPAYLEILRHIWTIFDTFIIQYAMRSLKLKYGLFVALRVKDQLHAT